MKTILLLLLIFSAVLVAPAQDRPAPPDVLIPLPVATFFLEQNERAKLLQIEIDSLHADITLLEQREVLRVQQLGIEYQKQLAYDSLATLQRGEIDACHRSEAYLSKELAHHKKLTKGALIGGAGLAILLLILL